MSDQKNNRLNKHLALQLGVSRREADNLIAQKRIRINGKVAELGARFQDGDEIKVNNQPLTSSADYKYIMLNKPVGYVCSRKSQGDDETIYKLLPADLHHLKPVGRLDKDSSGLILLTNDGDFTYQMTHPKFYKLKQYNVGLDHDLAPLHQQMISDFGVQLEDGASKLSLERLSEANRRDWRVTMSEGRNRQIRRTFSSLGYKVVKLHRISFGNNQLDDLKSGQFKTIAKSS